jgi:homoprotocatechuate degradation regulator HpaR
MPMTKERPGTIKESVRKERSGATRVRLRDFSKSLPMSLLRAREAVMRHFRASLRQFNITEQQWRVLRALTTVETIEVTELARATYLLSPSLSRILRDLEHRRLIVRRNLKTDQRRSVVSISPGGLALIEAVSPQSEAIYARIASLYGAERLALLQDMLRELESLMIAHGPQGPESSAESESAEPE